MKDWNILKLCSIKTPKMLHGFFSAIDTNKLAQGLSSDIQLQAVQEHFQFLQETFLTHKNEIDLSNYFFGYLNRHQSINYKDFLKDKSLSCTEGYLPPSLADIVDKELICEINRSSSQKYATDYDVRLFTSKPNHVSHLHFDWTARPNVLIQIEGSKRCTLINPAFSESIGYIGNLGKKIHFEKPENCLIDAEEFILNPGDVLIMPPFYWHQIETISQSISISIRAHSHLISGYITSNIAPAWSLVNDLYLLCYDDNKKEDTLDRTKDHLIEVHNAEKDSNLDLYWQKSYLKYVQPLIHKNQQKADTRFAHLKKHPFLSNLRMLYE